MKRLTRDDVQAERLLRASRSVAVIGARPRAGDRTHAVVEYLKGTGYDLQPVRSDRADVAGLRSWARLDDVPGAIDLVLVLRGRADADLMEAARRKKAHAVWLEPAATFVGAVPRDLLLVRDREIVEAHRASEQVAGQPRKRSAVGMRRGRAVEEPRAAASGWEPRGGGGKRGGGGGRAVLDEKKMVRGRKRR